MLLHDEGVHRGHAGARSTPTPRRSTCRRHHPDEAVRQHNDELADLLTPITKAWCTDLGSELTSLAIQVHGGMGYIEETGVAQHYRDIRIAAIYEGTNGIQAMDLVGRKLPMRGGGAVTDLLDRIAAIDDGAAATTSRRSAPRSPTASPRCGRPPTWLLEHGAGRPGRRARRRDAVPPPVRPRARRLAPRPGQALGARPTGATTPTSSPAKVVTARFYCEQLLPQARGLLGAVTATKRDLFAITPAQLSAT